MFENFRGTNPKSVLNSLREIIYERLQKLEDVVGSGLSLSSIEFLTITFFENRVTIGSSCKPLPEEIAKLRGAIINVDNSKDDDQQCFKWAVTLAMFPVAGKRDATKLSANLRKQADKLNWNGINFPTTLHEIDIFENLNKISVIAWLGQRGEACGVSSQTKDQTRKSCSNLLPREPLQHSQMYVDTNPK